MNCSCIGFGAKTSIVNSKDMLALRNAGPLSHTHSSLSVSTAYCQITLVVLFFYFFFVCFFRGGWHCQNTHSHQFLTEKKISI